MRPQSSPKSKAELICGHFPFYMACLSLMAFCGQKDESRSLFVAVPLADATDFFGKVVVYYEA